ncbi:hypothetical protein [Xanthobacter autotrophicus]|uniref:hypothetical protein n=1 Tax=Xanthobacter autotrophicus TaxID=280 RepID=UPI003727A3F8
MKKTPQTIRKTLPLSDNPNHRMTMETKAMGGMGRNTWNSGPSRPEKKAERPVSRPHPTPTMEPTT